MRGRVFVTSLAAALLVGGGAAAHAVVPPGNVLVNSGADDAAGSADGGIVPIPGWVIEDGFTAVQYGTSGFPVPEPGAGPNFFAGGPQSSLSRAAQNVDLSGAASEIDRDRVDAVLTALVAPRPGGRVGVEFLDAQGAALGRDGISSAGGRDPAGPLEPGRVRVPVPPGARLARVSMTANDSAGGYNDVFFDSVSLRLIELAKPRPRHAQTVVVTPTKGKVRVFERRGHRKTIGGPTVVPVGSTVDASRGAALVGAAGGADEPGTSVGSFSLGVFAVTQTRGQPTVLSVGGDGPRVCTRPRRLASRTGGDFVVLAGRMATMPDGPASWLVVDKCSETTVVRRRGDVIGAATPSRSTPSTRVRRRLFGSSRGRFRTRGQNSSATVRGKIAAIDLRG